MVLSTSQGGGGNIHENTLPHIFKGGSNLMKWKWLVVIYDHHII